MRTEEELRAAALRLLTEKLEPISKLAKLVPASRAGNVKGRRGTRGHVSSFTLLRWITDGTPGGIHLDGTIGSGGGWVSSRPALARFLAARAARQMAGAVRPSPGPAKLERDAAEAEAELATLRGPR